MSGVVRGAGVGAASEAAREAIAPHTSWDVLAAVPDDGDPRTIAQRLDDGAVDRERAEVAERNALALSEEIIDIMCDIPEGRAHDRLYDVANLLSKFEHDPFGDLARLASGATPERTET